MLYHDAGLRSFSGGTPCGTQGGVLRLLFCAPQGKLIHRKVKAKAERANEFDRTY